MRPYRATTWILASLSVGLLAWQGTGSLRADDAPPAPAPIGQPAAAAPSDDSTTPPPTPSQEQPEALTRGPVNESFAEPVDTQTQAGVVATTQPPDPVQETPPSEKPEGGRYVWIPGYWAWDADRKDYIWVSGCWRAAPPHMYWVPGYWSQANGGWEWIAGYWAPESKEVQYLPAPPQDVDASAPGNPPSPDEVWVPPCYYWADTGYTLRPGYWLGAQAGWCWSPSHYVWTPRGYCFAPGYWDYSFERRGVLFAPVYFHSHHFAAGFVFSPGVTLDVGALTVNLFTYPRYCHYYFGDWYDNGYLAVGIYPWFECERFHTWYDPIFVYDRWHFGRSDPHWIDNIHHGYDTRHADPGLRPARTFREQETRLAHLPAADRDRQRIGMSLHDEVARKDSGMKFQKIDAASRAQISHQTADAYKYRQERSQLERPVAAANRAQRTEHNETPQPNEHHETNVTEHNQTPTPTAEHREAPTPTAEHSQVNTPRANVSREPTYSAPHETSKSAPERVQTRQSPIGGYDGDGAKGMPSSPGGESRGGGDGRSGGGDGRGGGGDGHSGGGGGGGNAHH